MFYDSEKQTKVTANRFFLYKDVPIRIITINKSRNSVTFHRYDTFENDVMEYDTAHMFLLPIFKIGEVAKLLNKKPDTLRKYEHQGLIPPVKKFFLTADETSSLRMYTEKDIVDLVEFFSNRGTTKKKYSAVNQKDVLAGLKARYHQISKVGGKP